MQHVYTTNTTDTNTPIPPIVPELCSKINCKPTAKPILPPSPINPPHTIIKTPYISTTQTVTKTDQSESNAAISPIVPDLCSTINRKGALNECLTQLSRTKTRGCNHKACVCIICDCFIIGVEKICWLSEKKT